MKPSFKHRAFCLAASVIFGCSSISGVLPVKAAAAERAECSISTEPVKVIVRLSDDAVLVRPEAKEDGTAFLETEQAASAEASIEEQQAAVEESIRRLYPGLAVRYRYTLLTNGFSCTLPESLIPAVEALPGVEKVERINDIELPQMYNASELCGISQFRNDTGCTGEGQVIAVIDSELDVTHPMFAALPEDTDVALTKEEVTAVINSGTLKKSVDPDRAYISSKLPYVIDYVDDPYEGVSDKTAYHGTHVSGIAAGNSIVTAGGKEISGIAKDAQIIFMACGIGAYYLDSDAGAAAIEDAVRLHADVINMSWGSFQELYEDTYLEDMLSAADNAGVSVCTSAGNCDNGTNSFNRVNYPSVPDTGTLNTKYNPQDGGMLIASADNAYSCTRGVFRHGDTDIAYRPQLTSSGSVIYMTDNLLWGTHKYVYADIGGGDALPEDLKGKILLTDRDGISFSSVAEAAKDAGADGLLVIDRKEGTKLDYVYTDAEFPIGSITYEEGEMLKNSEDKTLLNNNTSVTEQYSVKMSSYSSWGVSASLDLRPDITGIGGHVESAAYGGSTSTMSGTSMSSPYVAGCTALLRQYLKENGLTADGREKTDIIRNILMNSAEPLTEDTMYVNPRRQGAGLVSLEKAMQDKVIVTGDCGSGKINLSDKFGDTFSFNVHLTNTSSEDVRFADARLVLTTDDVIYSSTEKENIINGQQPLSCSCDLSALLPLAAGESRTETVTVALDAAQSAELQKVFVNGFFVEGFLMLEGASNCCDISVPVLGFHGDWAQLPVFKEDTLSFGISFGKEARPSSLTIGDTVRTVRDIISRMNNESAVDPAAYEAPLSNMPDYATNEELAFLHYGDARKPVWISPNGDGLADSFAGFAGENKRQGRVYLEVLDENGEVKWRSEPDELSIPGIYHDSPRTVFTTESLENGLDMSDLEEGEYTVRIFSEINNPDSAANPQIIENSIIIDKTAPEFEAEETERDGRRILRLTASDAGGLDCIFIIGNGKGFIAGADAPEAGLIPPLRIIDETSKSTSSLFDLYNPQLSASVPIVCSRLMSERPADTDYAYDFSDIIPVTENGNGILEVEYDITDLQDYNLTALDKAYNYTVIESEHNSISAMPGGVWLLEGFGYLQFEGSQLRYKSLETAQTCTVPYELKDLMLTIDHPDFPEPMKVTFASSSAVSLLKTDGSTYGTLELAESIPDVDDLIFYPLSDFAERMKERFAKLTGINDAEFQIGGSGDASRIVATAKYYDPEKDMEVEETIIGSLLHGTVSYAMHDFVLQDLYAEACLQITPGTYFDPYNELFFTFLDDGKSGYLLTTGGARKLIVIYRDTPFTYTLNEDGTITFLIGEEEYTNHISLNDEGDIQIQWGDGHFTRFINISETPLLPEDHCEDSELRILVDDYLRAVTDDYINLVSGYVGEDGRITFYISSCELKITVDSFTLKGTLNDSIPVDLRNIPTLPDGSYSLEELRDMASEEYSRIHDVTPKKTTSVLTEDGSVIITLLDRDMNALDTYTLDPVTATGSDGQGGDIDLPQTGNNDRSAAAAVSAALLLMLAGATLMLCSRRKQKGI